MNILKIKNLNFSYDKEILKDINMYLNEGELVSIVGKSGSGKTTLFNLIANIIPSKNEIFINNKNSLKISYLQQKDLLLEHLNVLENIALPLIINKENKKIAYDKSLKLLDDFKLSSLAKKYPKNLSGGQRQRISFLRAIILKASLYLLDEPFNALDFFTKNYFYEWIKNIQKMQKLSILLITHDINEAVLLSDRIYLLQNKSFTKHLNTKQKNIKNEIYKAFSIG